MITEDEIRGMLEYAIEDKNKGMAQTCIRAAMAIGISIHKMTDLHFGLMLLLASPDPENRGRPNDPDAELLTWLLNMACKIKADIEQRSFSYTWSAYCDRTRPKKTADELWRCAGILQFMLQKENKQAIQAVATFELSPSDIKRYESCE